MQRAKYAGRKQETRRKILIGEAAMRAGAGHLPVDEIEAVLEHYVQTGGGTELQSFVSERVSSASISSAPLGSEPAKGGSEAIRRGDTEIDPVVRTDSVSQ